jgi:hypothetical protein
MVASVGMSILRKHRWFPNLDWMIWANGLFCWYGGCAESEMKRASSDNLFLPVEWYGSEQDYLSVLALLPISEQQNAISYDAFRAEIKSLEKRYKEKGFIARRIVVTPLKIKWWCKENGYPVCKTSIIHFVAESLAVLLESN